MNKLTRKMNVFNLFALFFFSRRSFSSRSLSSYPTAHCSLPTAHCFAAFTIIELLVVISIIAILLGLALPSFLPLKDVARQRKAVVTAKHLELAFSEYCNQNQSWPGADGLVKGDMLNKLIGANPQGVAYFEIGTNSVNTFFDPWGNYYQVHFDSDFNNKVALPDDVTEISKSVIVWSVATNSSGAVVTNKSWE